VASTNFLQHNPSETNQENDATYAADSIRTGGIGTNEILPSVWLNKVWFQSSTFIAAFCNAMVTKGYTLLDSNLATLATVLANVLTLADSTFSFATNGYVKFPGGLIIQWMKGSTTLPASTREAFSENWPIAFPNTCFHVQTTVLLDNALTLNNQGYAIYVNPGSNLSTVSMYSDVGPDGLGDTTHRVFMLGIGN
jgi:hypothetical protein